MDNYKITQYSVNTILGLVESGQIAIPEIQRPFVWKPKEVKDLIDSLYQGYPIGYLIVWQNSQVRVRGFGKGGTKKILIDGQQRVTALMAALLGREVLDDHYRSRRIRIAFNPLAEEDQENFVICDESIEKDPLWISDISMLFRRDFSYRKFENDYMKANPGKDFSRLESSIDTLRDIPKHQVGVIELSFLLDIDVVSEIFIRINLQGKPLNQEDFVMSKISVNEQYNGDYIRNTIDYFCHLLKEPSFYQIISANETEYMKSDYGRQLSWLSVARDHLYIPSYADVLKVVSIACFGRSKAGDLVALLSGRTGKRGEVSKKLVKDSFSRLGRGVKTFVSEECFTGFQKALIQAGYCCDRLLYSQSVLNYCYAMYLLMTFEGLSEEKKASLIGKWMTMVLITGHYQGSPDSTVMRDAAAIREQGFESYLSNLETNRMDGTFYGEILPAKFLSTTVRTAPFLAYIASLCARGVHGLYSKDQTISSIYAEKSESYQILSKGFLSKCGFSSREIYGQVANITYISKDVKAVVKRQAPADYRESLEKAVGKDLIRVSLKEHGLTDVIFTLDKKSVEIFFDQRRKKMARQLETYYKSL